MSMKPENKVNFSEESEGTCSFPQKDTGIGLEMSDDEKVYQNKYKQLLETIRAVCHELSQPITVISGYSELLLLKKTEKDLQYEKLLEIRRQADIVDGTIRRLRDVVKYSMCDGLPGDEIIGGTDKPASPFK